MALRNFAMSGLLALVWTASAPAAAEPDRLTPSDAEMVAQINVRQLLQTPFAKKHALDAFRTSLRRNNEVQQFLSAAGLDPLKDIDSIALSASGNPMTGAKLLTVVRGHFDIDKARTAAEDYAKKCPDQLKSFTRHGRPMWEITSDNQSLYAAFADNKTLVVTAAAADTVAVVERAGRTPQRPSAALQAALAHLKGGEGMWMAMAVTEKTKQLFKGDNSTKDFAAALQSVTGVLELSDDAQFGLVVHTNNPKAAVRIKGKLEELKPLLAFLGASKDKSGRIVKTVMDNLKLKTEKQDVSIHLRITDAQIDKVNKKGR